MANDYLTRLSDLEARFSALSQEFQRGRQVELYVRGRNEAWKNQLVEIMEAVAAVVQEADEADPNDLEHTLQRVETLLNRAISMAYSGWDYKLFENVPSFAHGETRPLIKLELGENVHPRAIVNDFKHLLRIMGKKGPLDPALMPKTPPPWNEVPPAHSLSSRCSRFAPRIPDANLSPDNLLALSVFQARAEISSTKVLLPTTMFASQSGKGIFVPAQGGYRNRSPYVAVFYPHLEPSCTLKGETTRLSLDEVAHHGAADDESGLLFVGDRSRIKSYSFWDNTQDEKRDGLVPTHTLNSGRFENAICVVPQGRVVRAGIGGMAVWNFNDLPTHQTVKSGVIGKDLGPVEEEAFSSRRDDTKNIENSGGSKPSAVIKFSEKNLVVSRLHNHPNTRGTLLASTNNNQNSQFYCRSLDMEQDGKWVARYIGHGGEINDFSTSKGDHNVFVTACNDNYARLYDVRHPLPVMTIEAGDGDPNCSSAVLCHPDGLPYIFASQEASEAITLWDVRARAAVYDLATGNNCVSGMAWSNERNELYAATYCRYLGTDGSHIDYAPARIPAYAKVKHGSSGGDHDNVLDDDEDSDYDDDDDDDEDDYDEMEQAWLKRAFHEESYFGHVFDSGDSRIFRYAFKVEPNLEIVPPDGQFWA